MADKDLAYEIDVEVTTLYGVTVQVFNGTSIEKVGDLVESQASDLHVSYSAYSGNRVWLRFITVDDYERGSPTFLAKVTLKSFAKSENELNCFSSEPCQQRQPIETAYTFTQANSDPNGVDNPDKGSGLQSWGKQGLIKTRQTGQSGAEEQGRLMTSLGK